MLTHLHQWETEDFDQMGLARFLPIRPSLYQTIIVYDDKYLPEADPRSKFF